MKRQKQQLLVGTKSAVAYALDNWLVFHLQLKLLLRNEQNRRLNEFVFLYQLLGDYHCKEQ